MPLFNSCPSVLLNVLFISLVTLQICNMLVLNIVQIRCYDAFIPWGKHRQEEGQALSAF
jgi:hypothetical protein